MASASTTAIVGGKIAPAVPQDVARQHPHQQTNDDPRNAECEFAGACLRQTVNRPPGRSDRDVRDGEVSEQQRRHHHGYQESGLVGLADAAACALEDQEAQAEAEDRPQQGPDELNDLGHGPMIPLMKQCRGPDESMKKDERRPRPPIGGRSP